MKVKRIGNHGFPIPSRETDQSAGYDLRSTATVEIAPGHCRIIPTGFAFAIPPGFVGLIQDRSGMATKRRITRRAGVIDSDYRGEVGVAIVNESATYAQIQEGERVAQLVVVPALMGECEEVVDLGDTERGENGFGSTGSK